MNRATLFKELIESTVGTSLPFDRDACKKLMLKTVNGGFIEKEMREWGENAGGFCRTPAAKSSSCRSRETTYPLASCANH